MIGGFAGPAGAIAAGVLAGGTATYGVEAYKQKMEALENKEDEQNVKWETGK